MSKKLEWSKDKIEEMKEDYFPGLDPSQLSLKLFGRYDSACVRSVCNKLSEYGLRNKKGYDI